ncbi:hypothetical protein [Ruicaihuangia caeni]
MPRAEGCRMTDAGCRMTDAGGTASLGIPAPPHPARQLRLGVPACH